MAGQILYLLHATPAGQKLENDFFNFSGVLSQRTQSGELTCFGSLGLAILEANGQHLQRLVTHRFTREVITRGLLSRPNPQAVSQALDDIENQAQLTFSALQQALMQDPDGGQIIMDATLPAHIRNKEHDAVASVVDAHYRSYRQLRLLQYVAPIVDANADSLIPQAHQALDRALDDASLRFGIRQTVALAEAANLSVRHQHQAWRSEWQARQSQLEETEAAFDQAMDALAKASGQIFFLRKRAIEDALTRTERTAQAFADAYLANRVAEGAVRILADLDRYTRNALQRLQSTVQRLEQTYQYLENDAVWRHGVDELLPPDIDLIDQDLVQYWYEQVNPQPETGRVEALRYAKVQGTSLTSWEKYTPKQLADLLMAELAKTFQHLDDLGVEDIAIAQKERISPERWQGRLLEMAVPMCNLETVRLVDSDVQPAKVTVLGVADDRSTVFDQNPEMIVATGDQKRLVALVATLGLPLSALKQWPAWEKSHRRFHSK